MTAPRQLRVYVVTAKPGSVGAITVLHGWRQLSEFQGGRLQLLARRLGSDAGIGSRHFVRGRLRLVKVGSC